jgi:hypothetical protein
MFIPRHLRHARPQQGIAAAQPRQDTGSANHIMPGCRDAVSNNLREPYLNGLCVGIVRAMFHLDASLGFCVPDRSTVGQAVRVVVAYIDQRPERMHEYFEVLALEALRRAWPCRR